MSTCCAHNVGKYRSMKLDNKSFENMANLKYLGNILKKLKILCNKKVRANYV